MTARALPLAFIFGLGCLLIGCPTPDDETLIQRIIRSAIAAANDRKPSDVLARVADEFQGPQGMSRGDVQRMLLGRLLQDRWLRVFERSLTVEAKGTTATARLDVVLAQGKAVARLEDLLPTDASVGRFDLILEKRGTSWWIVGASYTRTKL